MASKIIFFFSFVLILGCNSRENTSQSSNEAVTTYYLIRHAEKDRSDSENDDPALTEKGLERAVNWAEVLKDIDFDAVYSTNYKRTRQTAKPLADLKNLEVLSYDDKKLDYQEFKKKTSGKTVLVVGHSNTTPQFANAILGEKKYENIDDLENGTLFIVQVLKDDSVISQVININ